MSARHERFVRWFLRLNGYFTIESFIVHAAYDPERVFREHVAPHTETDILGVRMPYSREISGKLHIANFAPLVANQNGRVDAVIAEVKSGNSNRPNAVWRSEELQPIKYVARFIGLFDNENQIEKAASSLATDYFYESGNDRIRYIVFAQEPNEHYQDEGVTYITFNEMISFLVETRGQCWVEKGIGVASLHGQWDPLIVKIFKEANNHELPIEQRIENVVALFDNEMAA